MTSPRNFRRLSASALGLMLLAGCADTPATSTDPSPAAAESSSTPQVRGERAVVERVIDGDTIDVSLGGDTVRVRLLNIDTPETKDPNEIVECLGPEATEYLEGLLAPGTPVGLEYDREREDSYGRTLAGVFLEDGRLVNAEIAREGLGTPMLIEPNDKFLPPVEEAFAEAESAEAGLLDPATDCTLPTQVEDATEAVEDAAPEDLADSTSDAAEAASFLATLDAIDRDAHPFVRHLMEITSIDNQVSKLRSNIRDLEQQAQQNRNDSNDRANGNAQRGNSGSNGSGAQGPAAPQGPRNPAPPAPPAAPAAPQAPAAPRVEAPAAPAPAAPPAPNVQAPAPPPAPAPQPAPKPAPQPAPNVVEEAPPGYVSELPGYTGPRCYAPGGKVFKPC